MRPQTQAFRHDPANGVHGDCYRTALAVLLGKDRDEVPHFLHDGCDALDFNDRIAEYLATLDMQHFSIPLQADDAKAAMVYLSACSPDVPCILSGMSPRGTCHAVVVLNGSMVCDPHPDGGGLVAPCTDGYFWIELATPLHHY